MRPRIVSGTLALLAVAALLLVLFWWDDYNKPEVLTFDDETSQSSTQPQPAEPGIGGFYQIKWQCHGANQQVSFHILTQGQGTLRVVIEDIDPSTQPYRVKQVVSEDVSISDSNRDEVESRTFSALIQSGHHVHFGLAGASGSASSEDHTFPALVCNN